MAPTTGPDRSSTNRQAAGGRSQRISLRALRTARSAAVVAALAPLLIAPAISGQIASKALVLMQLMAQPLLTAAAATALTVAVLAGVHSRRLPHAVAAGLLGWSAIVALPVLAAIADSPQAQLLDVSMIAAIVFVVLAIWSDISTHSAAQRLHQGGERGPLAARG